MGLILNSTGVEFDVDVKDSDSINSYDLSSATVTNIIVTYPSGKKETWSASLKDGGVNGVITYTTQPGDLDEIGIYSLIVHIVTPTFTGDTSSVDFEVRGQL